MAMKRNAMIMICLTVMMVTLVSTVQSKHLKSSGDLIQTIPPIVVSSVFSQAECTILNLSPGSVIANTVGVIMANCLNQPAVLFGVTSVSTVETPTFLLTTGWTAIGIQVAGLGCGSPNVIGFPGVTALNLTSGSPITFQPQGTVGALDKGLYNYCLYYSNPPIGGILSFTISWTP